MIDLLLFVPGIPAPKGSKAFKGMRGGHAILVESSKREAPWAQRVTNALMRANVGDTINGAAGLHCEFLMPRPKRLGKKNEPCVVAPDVDKCVRSVKDAITKAGIWFDDSQVMELTATKRYADIGEEPGAHIRIYALFPEFIKPMKGKKNAVEKAADQRAGTGRAVRKGHGGARRPAGAHRGRVPKGGDRLPF